MTVEPTTSRGKNADADKVEAADTHYKLTLYVSGASPKSARAVENIKTICEKHLQGQYDLAVVDVYQHPEVAKAENLLAAPTLVKSLPLPLRKLLGDMSDEAKVLAGLNIETTDK